MSKDIELLKLMFGDDNLYTGKYVKFMIDKYGVEEEPMYYALIKGHELTDSYDVYWNYDKFDDNVFVTRLHPLYDNFITEMSKSEWNELGINETNADLIEVDR